jgi:hypothetical protein
VSIAGFTVSSTRASVTDMLHGRFSRQPFESHVDAPGQGGTIH